MVAMEFIGILNFDQIIMYLDMKKPAMVSVQRQILKT